MDPILVDVATRSGRAELHVLFHPTNDGAASQGRGVVVTQGIGLTADSRPIPQVTEALHRHAIHVVTFDPEGFGRSETMPARTGVFTTERHRDDLRQVLRAAQGLDGVDPKCVGLLGYSYGAGHRIAVAAEPGSGVAAVVARAPFVLGAPYVVRVPPMQLARLVARGVVDQLLAPVPGHTPRTLPVVGPPTSRCIYPSPGAGNDYRRPCGPTWRNAIGRGSRSTSGCTTGLCAAPPRSRARCS